MPLGETPFGAKIGTSSVGRSLLPCPPQWALAASPWEAEYQSSPTHPPHTKHLISLYPWTNEVAELQALLWGSHEPRRHDRFALPLMNLQISTRFG